MCNTDIKKQQQEGAVTDSDYAHGLLHTAAKSMAASALEIVTDEGVRNAVRAAFEADA